MADLTYAGQNHMTDAAPLYPHTPAIQHLSFRNSKLIYYGPHACSNCGVLICKMGHEFGGNAFTYPSGPIYPNTEWHPHVCDPKRAAELPKSSPDTAQPAPPPSLSESMARIYARCVAITTADNTLSDITRAMVNEIGELCKP